MNLYDEMFSMKFVATAGEASLLFSRTYSQTWVFPSVRVVLIVTLILGFSMYMN